MEFLTGFFLSFGAGLATTALCFVLFWLALRIEK